MNKIKKTLDITVSTDHRVYEDGVDCGYLKVAFRDGKERKQIGVWWTDDEPEDVKLRRIGKAVAVAIGLTEYDYK